MEICPLADDIGNSTYIAKCGRIGINKSGIPCSNTYCPCLRLIETRDLSSSNTTLHKGTLRDIFSGESLFL